MKHGINLPRPTYYGEQLFLDLMKQSNPKLAKGTALSDGWFTNGDVTIGAGLDKPGPYTVTIGRGSATVGLTKDQIKITKLADAKDIRVVRTSEADMLRSGGVFRPAFLDALKGNSCVRAMDWMGTNGSTVTNNRPRPSDRTYMSGVPVEIIAMLGNILNQDIWIQIPHLMSDEQAQELVKTARDILHPWLNVYVEYSNEVWNSSFPQSKWANTQAKALWGSIPGATNVFYGYRCAQLAKAVAMPGVRFVLGTQTAYFELSKYVLQGIAKAGGSISQFYGWIATFYIDGGLRAANAKAIDLATRNDVAGAIKALADDMPRMAGDWKEHGDFAKAHGLALLGYEGNVSWIAHAAKDAATKAMLIDFFARVQRDERMLPIMKSALDAFAAAGAELACGYTLTGNPSEYGYWGMLESVDDRVGLPAWRARAA